MKNVFLGEYIKQRRLDLGLTQEQLCDGICEPMTLSRLENGKQTPSRNRINALLQRLGLPDDRYFALLSKNELEMEALQKEIVACNANHRVEEGFETLKKFEQIADHDDQIAQQFILRSKVLLGRLDQRYTPQEQIDLLMQAIRLTVPRFNLDEIERFFYSTDEIKIINQRGWPPKTMPSSHLCVNCFRVSKIVLHGFCTESARFHPVQWLTTGAKFTSGRET